MEATTLLWILLGLGASLLNTAIPLTQEKIKANGLALAIWIKIVIVALSLPVVLMSDLPTNPTFYILTAVSGAIWCINDVIYFRTVPIVGAGVVSRILPASVILSFVVWFFFDPDLLFKYLEQPWQAAGLTAIVFLSVFFAISMKSCPVTWQGIQLLWFVVLAAAIGPLIDKLSLGHTASSEAPFVFMFFQALVMLAFWTAFILIKKPIAKSVFLAPSSLKGGAIIGIVETMKLALKFQALIYCEHPALLSVILFTDALWIIFYYRLTGRKDHSKIWAGLGLVGTAAALVLVKSL